MKKLCIRLVILFAVLLALPVCAENKFCEVGFKEIRLTFQERDYKAELKNIDADSIAEGVDIIEKSKDSSMYVMYLFDETDINTYIQKLKDERFVVGLV